MLLTGFRAAAWDTPLWVLPNRRAGRYNRAGEAPTQYVSLHPFGPWAEVLRHEEVYDEDAAAQHRPPLWALRFAGIDPMVLDFDNCGRFDLEPEDLVSDDHGPCQALASQLRADSTGPRALLVPSAALPGTSALVILDARVASPYAIEPVEEVDVPVALAAEDGRAPFGLTQRVRHLGSQAPHPALEAWRTGDRDFAAPHLSTAHLAA